MHLTIFMLAFMAGALMHLGGRLAAAGWRWHWVVSVVGSGFMAALALYVRSLP